MQDTVYYHVKLSGIASGTVFWKNSYGTYLASEGLSAANDPLTFTAS